MRTPYVCLEHRLIANSWHDTDTGCWVWLCNRNRKGYGKINLWRDKRHVRLWVHRVAYEVFIGPIPEGMTVDHTCWHTWCINPNHFELVTRVVNSYRKEQRPKRAA